jgi:tetratricopeptide (TPR) repeat protein
MLAELELSVGNYDGAQTWLERARGTGNAPAQRLAAAQAWTWYALGDMARGDAELKGAGPEDDAFANLARAARAARAGNAEQAGRWLERATASGPNERSFLHRATDLWASIGDLESAESLRQRAATASLP